MIFPWRDTLTILLPQFEARAAASTGLYHLFTEIANKDRHQATGPTWFRPFDQNIRIVDGKPHYSTWDCSSSAGMPGVNPGFREVKPGERLGHEEHSTAIRDLSGIPRAVPTSMKFRQGYFCGQPSEHAQSFSSLANAAATALAAASDLDEHPFAKDLIDLFRKPRGGVRFIFGDVQEVPDDFVARGWNAGVLQYKNGVLIDLPISERLPESGHWLLLLHRLGWRCIEGCPLKATRTAWNSNTEVSLEMLQQDWASYPKEFADTFASISPDSYYSVLGSKDAPLDVNIASAFAIRLLLADLRPQQLHVEEQDRPMASGAFRSRKVHSIPKTRSIGRHEVDPRWRPSVGLLVATEVERQAVLKRMRPPKGKRALLQISIGNNTYFLGRLGITDVALTMCAMGSTSRDSSSLVTTELLVEWQLNAVIMVGIAFGKDATKQEIGSVLISDRIISYEPERLSDKGNEGRPFEYPAGTVLLNRFRNTIGWDFYASNGRQCGFQCGALLSGEKLVDDNDFKQALFSRHPRAIGGEMEGAGVAAASARRKCEWIVVKAICDWGDGTKTDQHQEFAAAASVSLVEHVLNQVGTLDSLI